MIKTSKFSANSFFIVLLVLSMFLVACKNEIDESLSGYDLARPRATAIGKVLNEISGLAYDADQSALIAISDSKEKIFQIGLKTKKLKDIKENIVAPDSDLEDIVVTDTAYYLLCSWGEIKEVPVRAEDSSLNRSYDLGLVGQNDFESLYYDPTARALVMICKTCAHEKGKKIRTAFRFDLATKSFDSAAFFTISNEEVENLVK